MKLKNFIVVEIQLYTLAGAEINKAKEEASQLAKTMGGRVKFDHNGSEYIADSEGNVAKTN